MGKTISRSANRSSPDLCDERARFGRKISWEWKMSVDLGLIMVGLAKDEFKNSGEGRSPRTPYPNLNSHLNIYFDLCRCRHLYCLWKDHVSYSEGRGIETGIEDGFICRFRGCGDSIGVGL